MARELMPKSGIMMPHVVVTRDAAVVGVSTVDGQAGAIDLTGKYLQKTDAAATYQTKTEGASKDFVLDSIQPIMSGALFREDPWVVNDTPFRSTGANGVESVDMMKVTPDNSIKIGSYASSVQGVEIHSAGRLQVVDQNDSGVETKYPVYSKRYRPEIEDLPFAAIGSYVKDSKGRTIGVTRTGINSDIKQLTQKVTFTQPVTVADAVGDYDAVTLRQLRNSGGGSGGPTMSGISNFGIGDFHLRDSRAFIPAFEVVSDGQLLNRADYPDLWAYAQLLSPIEDSLWLSNIYQRGRYSTGNGTTTFRVPDRNGIQEGSLRALYGRGDGGNSAANGQVFDSAAPNITYASPHTMVTLASAPGQVATNGAIQSITSTDDVAPVGAGGKYISTNFDASRSSPIYGRSTDEILTRNFVGVWTIRAHGGFVAANTSWSVINRDSAAPALNTSVVGGKVESKYTNPTSSQYARMYISSSWGSVCSAVIEAQGTSTHAYKFYEDGTVDFRQSGKTNPFRMYTPTGIWTGLTDAGPNNLTTNGMDRVAISSGSDTVVRGYSIGGSKPNGYPTKVGHHMYLPGNDAFGIACTTIGGDNGRFCRYFYDIDGQMYGSTDYGNFSYTKSGVSDENLKHNIVDIDAERAIEVIKGLKFKSFVYNDDEKNRSRRGIIAQQAETVEPLYVKTRKYPGMEKGSPEIEQKELDTTPMLLDTMQVVQDLLKRIEVLESKLAEK
ncbi:putative tail protein [Escherichia phage vB_EcoP_SU10]|uniref:Putative tail protein n=1 Tax=Escherichia phage vB_EcoP_SU10 TaxID=1519788 RepID=A0A0B4N0U7_9CAUD|nr:tail fiber protein [Escherichia phage vB_EcoP_SU10]AIF71766.1 putative tail protein [Escherichia phage vB_EcoP_SU10]